MVCPPISLCIREVGMSSMARLTAQVRRIWTKLHAIRQFEDPLFCSLCSMYAAVRTDSPKRLLTRPLNGWKPDSRIFLANSSLTRICGSTVCQLVLLEGR